MLLLIRLRWAALLVLLVALPCAAVADEALPRGAVCRLGEHIPLRPRYDPVAALAFAPDGRTLTTWTATEAVRWDVATGRQLGEGRKPATVPPPDRATSPDRRRKAAVDENSPGMVAWDGGTGKPRVFLGASTRPLRCVVFSPDGKVLLAAGDEGTVVAWETRSDTEVFRIQAHPAGVTALAFSPDNRHFATGSADGSVLLWRLTACGPPLASAAALRRLGDRRLEDLFETLGSDRATDAWYALRVLAEVPEASTPFLRRRLPPPFEIKQVERWLRDLDDDSFETREKASAELAKVGRRIGAVLTRRLEDNPPPEARRRMRDLIDRVGDGREEYRAWSRAVQVLEQAGSPEAREVLRLLAEENRVPAVADEAAAALHRIRAASGRSAG
jgi:hypothetical protein